MTPSIGTRPWLGLKPTMPQKAAGPITERLVWVPSANGHSPAATAAAEPLLEPPGVCARLCGLRVAAGSLYANSSNAVLPRIRAPASRRALTLEASGEANSRAGRLDPARVGRLWTLNRSLMPTGMPYSGGRVLGSGQRSA